MIFSQQITKLPAKKKKKKCQRMPVGGIKLWGMLQHRGEHLITFFNFCKILARDEGEGERRLEFLPKCKMRDQSL